VRAFASWLRPWSCALVENALLSALLVALAHRSSEDLLSTPFLPRALVVVLTLQLCLYYNDLYEDFVGRRVELFVRVGQSFGVGVVVLALAYFVYPPLGFGRGLLALYLPLAFCALVAWRFVFLWGAGHEALRERVLILGTGQAAQQIAREIVRRAPLGFTVVGFVGESQAEVRPLTNPPVIGTNAELVELVGRSGVGLIVVALDDRRNRMPLSELLQCRLAGVVVEEAASFYERIAGNIPLQTVRPSWLVFASGFHRPELVRNLKRVSDFVLALALLALLAPLFVAIALLIKLTGPGPIFYRQERVGEKGKVFWLIKFRSMRVGAEADTGPVWAGDDNDPRVTRIGRYLRRLRLDELPQLLNVLPGEMSFVGPRPERPHFVDMLRKVVPYYDQRHNVKPGITGWAQIKYGYASTIEDAERKLQFDLYYVKNMSFLLDVAIILDTVKVMLPGRAGRDAGGR
jgi:sugar transferase (PEP-CTERM system associated)